MGVTESAFVLTGISCLVVLIMTALVLVKKSRESEKDYEDVDDEYTES